MSLLTQSGAISIQNASNQTKFTSRDRLVFQRAMKTGSITLSGNGGVLVPFVFPNPNDDLLVSILMTSSSGLSVITTSLLNREMPGNMALVVDINARAVSSAAAVDQETFSVSLCGSDLHFRTVRVDYAGNIVSSITNITLTYKARLISYI